MMGGDNPFHVLGLLRVLGRVLPARLGFYVCDFCRYAIRSHGPLISANRNTRDRRFAKREMSGRVNANITFTRKTSGQVK